MSETQGWQLRRLLSFLKNRVANRRHRPRDPELRELMALIGVVWEDESDSDSESSSSDEESDDGGEASVMDEGEDDNEMDDDGVTHGDGSADGSAPTTLPEVHMDSSDGGQGDEVIPNLEDMET